MTLPVRVLCVCSHNRTRSVLAGALLGEHCHLVGLASQVTTAGTLEGGYAPTSQTVQLLSQRGVDVEGYRSRVVTNELVKEADLVITAERSHVVWIAGLWPDAFATTFALPEIVARAEAAGPRNGRPFAEWLASVGQGRKRGLDYIEAADFADVADPTGLGSNEWAQAVARIDHLTRRLAQVLK